MVAFNRNCKNCKFGHFNKCLRGGSGELLDYDQVAQSPGQHDEYDSCCAWTTRNLKEFLEYKNRYAS